MTTHPMPKRTAGQPPALALGTMNFGKRTPADESARIVRRALERGIRVFDTANAYNDGESERILGRALGADLGRVVVATKVGFGRPAGKPEGLAPEVLERAIAGSLERLGTDHVDVYYLHVPDHHTPIERTLDAMKGLVDAGRARAWGVSNFAAWQILEMNQLADARSLARPVVSQVLYNTLHRQLDVDYFAFTRRHPIHTTVFNPLAGGLLAGTHHFDDAPPKGSRFDGNALYRRRYWTRAMFDRVAELRTVAEREGMTLLQLAYAWVASRPEVDSILVGPATVQQLDDAFDALEKAPSADALARIDELSRTWSGTDTNYVR
ncbi:MAG TPA: aldo/keto reductase [Polyangiaceae bacterium]|jgi:aryl-alcohol dehydrogenase-like predicted oxidoreductase